MLAEKGKRTNGLQRNLAETKQPFPKNACQPPLEALIQISQCLEVGYKRTH